MANQWGYTPVGRGNIESPDTHNTFWPESGKGYIPKSTGYAGVSPSGGMRLERVAPRVQLRPGYDPLPTLREIYDPRAGAARQPTTTAVGWWGNWWQVIDDE
jgi:hypothetical protein